MSDLKTWVKFSLVASLAWLFYLFGFSVMISVLVACFLLAFIFSHPFCCREEGISDWVYKSEEHSK